MVTTGRDLQIVRRLEEKIREVHVKAEVEKFRFPFDK